MAGGTDSRTFYDALRERAFAGGSGEPVTVKRTVYGTKDEKMYELSDGKLYRVRRAKKNGD